MARISLVDVDPYVKRKTYESLGLGTLAAVLRQHGDQVQLMKAYVSAERIQSINSAERQIRAFQPRLVGSTAYNTNIKLINNLFASLKRTLPDVITLVGGVFATLNAQAILEDNPAIDGVVLGEAEDTILEIAERMTDDWRADLSGISGIWWRSASKSPDLPTPRINLDDLPAPARDITYEHVAAGQVFTSLSTARGCYGACSFCSVNTFSHIQKCPRWRGRSPQLVVDEMEHLACSHQIQAIFIEDSSIEDPPTLGKQRIRKLCEEIIRRRLHFFLRFEARAESFQEEDAELLDLMRRAGFCYVIVGMESGADKVLRVYNKRADASDNAQCYRLFTSHGIFVFPSTIMFQPYATFDDLRESAALLFSLNKSYRFDLLTSRLSVYSNTPIYHRLKRDGLITPEFTYRSELDYRYINPDVQRVGAQLIAQWKKTDDFIMREIDYLLCTGRIFAESLGLQRQFQDLEETSEEIKRLLSANHYAFFVRSLDLAERQWDTEQFTRWFDDLAVENRPHLDRMIETYQSVRKAAIDHGVSLLL